MNLTHIEDDLLTNVGIRPAEAMNQCGFDDSRAKTLGDASDFQKRLATAAKTGKKAGVVLVVSLR